MTSPTPAYPELWRVSHANLLDEGPESSSEARSPSSPSPYPEIVSSASWNAHEDLNLVIRLEATDLERKELSGDSMPSVSADDVLDSKLTGGGQIAIGSPGLFAQEVLDPLLSAEPSTGIMQASGGNGQQPGSLQGSNGSQASTSQSSLLPSMGQMQSRIPRPISTASMNPANPSRFVGRHTSPHAVHCCGFRFHPEPLDISAFRRKLLLQAAHLSQWTNFRSTRLKDLPTPLRSGDWVYEVRQSSILPNGMMQQRYFGFFYGGDSDTEVPWSLATDPYELTELFHFRRVSSLQLDVQCLLPGHFHMSILVWMKIAEFRDFADVLRAETFMQRGYIGF